MAVFLTVLILLICLFLALIVLVQNPKGGGLVSGFSSASQIGGVRKTTDFLEKATWVLAIALVVLCLFSGGLYGKKKVVQEQGQSILQDVKAPFTSAPTAPAVNATPVAGDENN